MLLTKERIKLMAHEIGFHACGITEAEPLPNSRGSFGLTAAEVRLKNWTKQGKHGEMKYLEQYDERKANFWSRFSDAKSIIVLGVNYYSDRGEACLAPTEGRVARYAWGRDYHQLISEKAKILSQRLKQETSGDYYFESAVDTKPLLERNLAQRAGLGFIGKQTQLLSLQFGPWLFLSELITNLDLEPDQPFQGSCGTCRLCIDECPTEAIEESGEIDARKCIAYLTIEHKTEIPETLRPKIGNWVFGCDECLNVCPYTAKQKQTNWNELTAEGGFGSELELLELFELKSNREHENQFGDTAISRASRKQLLRNAAIVLGNKADRSALPVLEAALPEAPVLAKEHIEWAIQEIKKRNPDLNSQSFS